MAKSTWNSEATPFAKSRNRLSAVSRPAPQQRGWYENKIVLSPSAVNTSLSFAPVIRRYITLHLRLVQVRIGQSVAPTLPRWPQTGSGDLHRVGAPLTRREGASACAGRVLRPGERLLWRRSVRGGPGHRVGQSQLPREHYGSVGLGEVDGDCCSKGGCGSRSSRKVSPLRGWFFFCRLFPGAHAPGYVYVTASRFDGMRPVLLGEFTPQALGVSPRRGLSDRGGRLSSAVSGRRVTIASYGPGGRFQVVPWFSEGWWECLQLLPRRRCPGK